MALDFTIIGQRLKQARINKDLTQENLAEKLGVSVAFWSRIERGLTHVSLKRLSQACQILNISEGTILNGTASTSHKYLTSEFSEVLNKCTPEKQKLIYKLAKVISEDK